jgi:hypothetical protein
MPRFAAATVIIAGVAAIDRKNCNDNKNSMRREQPDYVATRRSLRDTDAD